MKRAPTGNNYLDIQRVVRRAKAQRAMYIGDAIAAGLTTIARLLANGGRSVTSRWRPSGRAAAR